MKLCIDCEHCSQDCDDEYWCDIPKGKSGVDGEQMYTHTKCENTRYTSRCQHNVKYTNVVIEPQPDV